MHLMVNHMNWALPGAACSYDGTSSVDKTVLNAVSTQLTGALDHLFPGQKRISTDNERFDSEHGESEWRQRVIDVAS